MGKKETPNEKFKRIASARTQKIISMKNYWDSNLRFHHSHSSRPILSVQKCFMKQPENLFFRMMQIYFVKKQYMI